MSTKNCTLCRSLPRELMSRPRDKGNRVELLALAELPGAIKISRMYVKGDDLRWLGRLVQVKALAQGWKLLYRWLPDGGLLMLKADRKPFLVVLTAQTLRELMAGKRE